MAEPLTDARRAFWNAIRNWPDTSRAFTRQYDFEKESAGIPHTDPSISDFPSIAVFPGSVDPRWWTNRMQEWPISMLVEIHTPDWYLPSAETLIRKVIEAVFQSKPVDPGPGYVEALLNGLPEVRGVRIERTRIGTKSPIKATRSEITFLLKVPYDPLGRV